MKLRSRKLRTKVLLHLGVRASLGQYIFNRSIPICSVETAEESYRHKLRRTDRNVEVEKG